MKRQPIYLFRFSVILKVDVKKEQAAPLNSVPTLMLMTNVDTHLLGGPLCQLPPITEWGVVSCWS